ncbi:spindle and centriole-associated 1-like [Brachionus plicatilis]|uniref:Spindle and centriole-associated protein 1 n=1 Tax=Brachionus plicatilis TaxID=10195 RepID=A0A3M7Q504_BRAPC|nr:spindle and centriole-associated 1-like [Brachionus plicatilis]
MLNSRARTASTSSNNRSSVGNVKSQNSTKKITRTKPAWDSNKTDMSQHKATNEELERRKAVCKSKNIDHVKFENQKKEILKNKNNQPTDTQSKLALLKEILYDDEQIKNLIVKSDSTLKVVRDFFDDETNSANFKNLPKKQPRINLTLAPNVTDLNESNLPFNNPKANDKKSGVFQIKCKNLNESDTQKSDFDAELNDLALKIKSNNINLRDLQQVIDNLAQNCEKKIKEPAEKSIDETLENKNQSSSLSNFNDELKKALSDLEYKLSEFENHVGKQKNADGVIKKSGLNFSKNSSSYTIQLIQVVSNLIDYLRDAVIELNYEKLKQTECSKQLDIHRKLIDGLTTEVLIVKEQNEKIVNSFMAQNAKLAAEMDQLKIIIKTNNLNHNNHSFDSKPSAFTSQPHEGMNVIKPVAQMTHEDKFSQRLNAMLHYDAPSSNLIKSTSVAQFQSLVYNRQAQNRPQSATFNYQNNSELYNEQFAAKLNSANRPSSSLSQNNSNQAENQVYRTLEFNSQMDMLKDKNMQVQERLKQLQQEHMHKLERKNSQSSDQSMEINDLDEKNKLEALERVKQEQQLLKEQINFLNKQRESAKQELEVLSKTSESRKDNNYIQNALMKHFEHFSLNYEAENGTNTPGLSPIAPELNQIKINEIKNLEITPTRNDPRIK